MSPCSPLRTAHAPYAVLLAAIVCSACHNDPIASERVDLLAQFAATDSRQEVLNLDLGGENTDARLGAGWSGPAVAPTGESILWSTARKLVVRATIREPHDRVIVVRCGTLAAPGTRSQVVVVRVNGRRAGEMTIDRDLTMRRVLLPARLQHRGENEITFGMRLGRGSNRLAVAYDTIRIMSPEGEAGPVPNVNGLQLVLPAASTVEYFLRIPPLHPALRFQLATDTSAALQIAVAVDGGAEATFAVDTRSHKNEIDLARYAGQVVRMRFTAAPNGALVVLQQPEVVGARPATEMAQHPVPARPANVVLFLVDTLRADHLGCYGYARPTSPRLDAFARESVVFTRTVAQASWTRPATASVLTGLNPQTHGVMTLRDHLPAGVPTMADLLRTLGHRTAGFVTNVNVAPTFGFQQGFDTYRYFPEDSTRPRVHVGVDEIEPDVFAWLAQHHTHPFFLYLHVTDPHAPYVPPSPFAEQLADPSVTGSSDNITARLQVLKRNPQLATMDDTRALMARYDGEIAFVDAYFGRLLDELRRLGLDDNTVVIFTADHGEEFLDHGGFEHGRTLYQEMLGIPLIMHLPQRLHAGVRSTVLARQIDLLPTVLDALGVRPPPSLQGRSLLPVLQVDDDGVEALTQTNLASHDLEGFVTGPWKIIQATHTSTEAAEIYQTIDDPQEQTNRLEERPILLGYARQRFSAAADQLFEGPREGRRGIDPATLERLRALGYTP